MVTKIYDGNKFDSTDLEASEYLRINSCGVQAASLDINMTLRESGRRDYTLLVISRGSCKAVYKGEEQLLSAGDMLIYPPHQKQKYSFSPNTASLWCHFSGSAVEDILSSLPLSEGVFKNIFSQAALESFLTLLRWYNSGKQGLCNAAFLELLFYLSSAEDSQSTIPSSISKVLDYIHISYQEPMTLERLAKISGYSKSRFSHLFSEYTNATPIQYINDLRLKNAGDMLRSTALSIGAISASCGFEDQLYFCKLFRRKYGISPSAYRKEK